MNFNGKKSEEEKYIYLFKCTKKKKWRWSGALQECGPDVLGHPGPPVTVGTTYLCPRVASWSWGQVHWVWLQRGQG